MHFFLFFVLLTEYLPSKSDRTVTSQSASASPNLAVTITFPLLYAVMFPAISTDTTSSLSYDHFTFCPVVSISEYAMLNLSLSPAFKLNFVLSNRILLYSLYDRLEGNV